MKNEVASQNVINEMQLIADAVAGIVGYENSVTVKAAPETQNSNKYYAYVCGKGKSTIYVTGLVNSSTLEKRVETICHEFTHLLRGGCNHTEAFYKHMNSVIDRFNA